MAQTPTPTSPARPPDAVGRIRSVLGTLRAGHLRRRDVAPLSDLSRPEAVALAVEWPRLPDDVREAIVRQVTALGEERLDLNFTRVLRVALDDASAVVRQLAVAGLWEDEGADLLARLMVLARDDASPDVRAEAARSLGRFAERAASGALPPAVSADLLALLGEMATAPAATSVERRRALEAVAPFNDAAHVSALIEAAYADDDPGMQVSAVHAMGRNLDERWLEVVMEALGSPDEEMLIEAARASGHFGDERAVPRLIVLAADEDAEIRVAAITALGEIGGRLAVAALRQLANEGTERDAVVVEAALAEADVADTPAPRDDW